MTDNTNILEISLNTHTPATTREETLNIFRPHDEIIMRNYHKMLGQCAKMHLNDKNQCVVITTPYSQPLSFCVQHVFQYPVCQPLKRTTDSPISWVAPWVFSPRSPQLSVKTKIRRDIISLYPGDHLITYMT